MKLWKDNKRSGEYELPEQEIADRFLASKYGDLDQYPRRLDRALSVFIADHEPDGLSSVWEPGDPAYERVVDIILAARRESAEADDGSEVAP